MSIINWIGIGIMAVIIIAGIMLYLHYRKKMNELDGLGGIITGEDKAEREGKNK